MYLRRLLKYFKDCFFNILRGLGIYDNFDFNNAVKFYSIEVGYIIDESDISLCDLDKELDTYMKLYNGKWTASDCGPFSISLNFKNHEMIRCNNYYIYDINLKVSEFKLKLPSKFFIDYIDFIQESNNDRRYKRIKFT